MDGSSVDAAAPAERSLLLVKPDGVASGRIGEVLRRVEAKGYRLAALDLRVADSGTLAEHYVDHVDKPFYPELEAYMTSGPVVVAVVEGERVVEGLMALCGPTDPTSAPPGTIRGDLGTDRMRNVVHRSDSAVSADREIKIWFPA